jgi:hypothetical protein
MHRRTNSKLPKLYEAQSLQETIQILGARKAPQVYNQLADMAWKIKDETGKIRENMLREAEINLQKDEKTLSEMIHEEKDTWFCSSSISTRNFSTRISFGRSC